jgi:predicted dinucleotide-binding enzyme
VKIGVLGTGGVGQALAGKLAEQGHDVVVGTRDPKATLAKADKDGMGNAPYKDWAAAHPRVALKTYREAAAHGEIVVNATSGHASLEALRLAGEAALGGKVLLDIANPLDFSKGMPPSLSVSNTDSLGEQIQKAFPAAKVVKTLNTCNAVLMVNPGALAGGDHTMFVCGNDRAAKDRTTELLKGFGWKHIIDLGDITNARGTEMLLPIWIRLMGTLQTAMFNFKIVK